MPDQPAKSFFGFTWGSGAKHTERLATPEELAEYGALAPDPVTEAKILALFEEQLLQDLVKESSGQPRAASAQLVAVEDEMGKKEGVPAMEAEEVKEVEVHEVKEEKGEKEEERAIEAVAEPAVEMFVEVPVEGKMEAAEESVSGGPAE